MFKKTLIIATLALASMAVSAQASMSYYATSWGNALNANGDPIENGTWLMVVDTNNNGFKGSSSYTSPAGAGADTASTWLWDSNDYIMARGQIGDDGYAGDLLAAAIISGDGSTIPGYSAGDNFYVLWFDVPFDANAKGPGANVHYGAELLGQVVATANSYDGDTLSPNCGPASFTTVPEPATMTLMLVGGILAIARRNRSAAK